MGFIQYDSGKPVEVAGNGDETRPLLIRAGEGMDLMTKRIGLLRRCTHAVDGINLRFLAQRLAGRATCRLATRL
jgi:hypothetical protein